MNCKVAEKNLGEFFRGTLKGNELRQTYYHLKECNRCKEVLLDEFSFYTTFNDLDTDLNFSYEKSLNRFMEMIEQSIKMYDYSLKIKYIILSILICVAFFVLLIIALKVVYR